MKILRKYFLKAGFISFICAGILVTFCKPVVASERNCNFADWLQLYVRYNFSPEVSEELNILGRSNLDINTIFKQAESILIANNRNLRHSGELVSAEAIHQYLLMKWNMYRSGKNMSAVLTVRINEELGFPSSVKPFIYGGIGKVLKKEGTNIHNFQKSIEKATSFFHRKNVIPLVNAISIGAP